MLKFNKLDKVIYFWKVGGGLKGPGGGSFYYFESVIESSVFKEQGYSVFTLKVEGAVSALVQSNGRVDN